MNDHTQFQNWFFFSASGMSFVSSWGEANPGGGKDRVEYFVNRARANAVDARDAIGTILKILDLV